MKKPSILIVTDYYLPGYKGGGPIRTIASLVHTLRGEFLFRILTTDRDWRDGVSYPGIERDRWTQDRDCPVCYLSPKGQRPGSLARRFASSAEEIVHLNGLFSRLTIRYLTLRRLGRVPPRKVILSPRGMLSPGSLRLKPWKKRPYLMVTKRAGFYRDLTWQASSEAEAADIRRVFPEAVRRDALTISEKTQEFVLVAADTSPIGGGAFLVEGRPCKKVGEANFVFLSRVSEVKNLEGVLSVLARSRSNVSLDIYGPVDNREYWYRCTSRISSLPSNVTVKSHGPVPSGQVLDVLKRHHFLFLPTRGENFGHVIVESLAAGVPVLISDRTPWRGLTEARAGWDIPLGEDGTFLKAVETCVAMGQEEYERWCRGAREYIARAYDNSEAVAQNRRLYKRLVDSSQGEGTWSSLK